VETEEHHLFAEFSKEYAYDCGITVCGEIDENNRFQMEYYYTPPLIPLYFLCD